MIIEAKIITGSDRSEVIRGLDNCYKIRLKSQPVAGQANIELIKILSQHFSVPKTNIHIKSGFRSNKKLIEIRG